MRIAGLHCHLLSAPYAAPGDAERDTHLRSGLRSAAIIEVTADDGVSGLGETYAGVYAPTAVQALVAQFAADIVGQPALETLRLRSRLHHASDYWGRFGLTRSVAGAIEMALWDLKGKVLGVPVFDLLGGARHERLPVYASGGNDKPLAQLEDELRAYAHAGYAAIKVRINNLSIDRIVEKVATCRRIVGSGIGLAADAVQTTASRPWPAKEALAVARALEPFDLLWLEEPCGATDYQGYGLVRRSARVRIAGGETVTHPVEAQALLGAGALDVFQPDATMIGGLAAFLEVALLCEHAAVPVAVHAWCGGVGLMGNYHAAFACPNCEILELPTVANPLRDELLLEPLRLENGTITAPRAPGLGVALPPGLTERYPFRPEAVHRLAV